MENTTRISDLPENITSQFSSGNNYIPINIHPNPYGNNGSNTNFPTYESNSNIKMTIQPQPPASQPPQPSQQEFQRLPSRDIRIDESDYTQDKEIKANYIPPVPKNMKDYLAQEELELEERMIAKHKKNKKRVHFADEWFVKLQIPVLVGFMFFLFQMSIFNKFMTKISDLSKIVYHIPFFKEDGNINFNGWIFKSIVFGITYFITIQLLNRFGFLETVY